MRRQLLLAFLALALPLAASAQSFDLSAPMEPFSVTVSPAFPAPFGKAVVSFVSGSVDLSSAQLSVSVSGKEIYKGSAKPLAIPLGKGGVPVSVQVRATSGGSTFTKSVTIVPQDVTIVAEPLASAPPLYPGKPLPPLEGKVRVVAVANLRSAAGANIDAASASYQWTVDGVQTATGSGIGKSAFTVSAPLQYRERSVQVTVTSPDGRNVGGASISFSGNEPTVRVYENDPLLSIRFDRAIQGSYTIAGTEASLYAAPYSFPNDTAAPLVQWFLNGSLAQTGNSVTLRPTGSGKGGASLSVVASSGDFSKATQALSLSFGANSGFNLFGL